MKSLTFHYHHEKDNQFISRKCLLLLKVLELQACDQLFSLLQACGSASCRNSYRAKRPHGQEVKEKEEDTRASQSLLLFVWGGDRGGLHARNWIQSLMHTKHMLSLWAMPQLPTIPVCAQPQGPSDFLLGSTLQFRSHPHSVIPEAFNTTWAFGRQSRSKLQQNLFLFSL